MAATMFNMNPAAQTLAARTPMAASSSSSSDSASGSSGAATVSANDFLTLLVTELKNQDPTANTDPNEYINQLVQVNSLQQLISINQVLTNSLGGSSNGTASTEAAQSAVTRGSAIATGIPDTSTGSVPKAANAALPATLSNTGNLAVPGANPSALGIAHALDGSRSALRSGVSAARP